MIQTEHRIIIKDSSSMDELAGESIDLVVTSPPYPMIEMWDSGFNNLSPGVKSLLEQGNDTAAFEQMHQVLDRVWCELYRVLKPGAIACINIGDAVRTINGRFQLYANHSRIQAKFYEIGFELLPVILWRKQTNAPNKFMGSGMLPAGAYVTLEHEYILLFRKGGKRVFKTPAEKLNRMQSAYFWEERNSWFSDVWDFKGTRQDSNEKGLRSRSAAYPIILPFRLINMYSGYGDTVLDPFLGTGTTTLAAMAGARNSVGYEVDSNYLQAIEERLETEKKDLNRFNQERLDKHLSFVKEYEARKGSLKNYNVKYGFPVVTKQETELKLLFVESVKKLQPGLYRVSHTETRMSQQILFTD